MDDDWGEPEREQPIQPQPESAALVKEFDDRLKARAALCAKKAEQLRLAADEWEKEGEIVAAYRRGDAMNTPARKEPF